MAIVKFHEKNISAFGKIEAVSGTYLAPATTDVLPATTLEGSITYETGSYSYAGSDLSRDEITYQKDSYADFTLETPMQVLGVLNPSLTVANAPLSSWMQACGAFITVNGGSGAVTYDNATVSNSSLSIDYRKTSSDDIVNNKLIKFTACRGSVDITASVGELPTFKFAFKGNGSDPVQSPKLIPDAIVLANQISNVTPIVRQATIVSAQLAPFGEPLTAQAVLPGTVTTITRVGNVATVTMSVAHNLTSGRKVNVSGATDNLYNGDFLIAVTSATVFTYTMEATPVANATGTLVAKAGGYSQSFCFSTLSASNFFGFDYTRYLTGCEEGFAKGAVPTDVIITSLESQAASTVVSGITFVTNVGTVTAQAHGLAVGNTITISGATGVDADIYNGTAVVLSVPTANTFTYTLAGTPAGVATGSIIVTNNSFTTFDPDANISKLFTAQIKFGTGNGRYITLKWSKLQLANVKEGKVASYFGRDITFRNTGNSYIILE